MDFSYKLYHTRKESDLWLLIQYERPQNVYDIIHSSDVIQKHKIQNGKIVDVRSGSFILKAWILMITDDRQFLEKEMRNLTRMPLNLTKGSETVEQRKPMETYTKSPTKYKPNTNRARSMPSPALMSNYRNESMNSSVEKHISAAIPLSGFNERTQTDNKLSAVDSETVQSKNLSKFLQKLDYVIMENKQIKEICNNLVGLVNDCKTAIKEIQRKPENNGRHIINSQMEPNAEPIVLLTESSNQSVNLRNANIDNSVAMETYDINNDNSNISHSNASRPLIASNESMCNNSNIVDNQSSASDSLNNTQSSNDSKRNWNEFQIDDELFDDVTIGSNGTKVPRMILDRIRWSNYTQATRKILSTLFSKDVLATHSLIGKPSPASIDSTMPTNNVLNALIISDIVQFISQKCGVTDTAVHISIATICADETKMYRQRMEKKRRMLQSIENENKENDLEVAHNLTM